MPMAEMIGWSEYAGIEPFGSHYDDLRAGMVVAATYNVHRDAAQQPQPFQPLDFAPWNSLAQQPKAAAKTIGAGMTPDELSALIDATMFGRAPAGDPTP